MHKNQSGFSLIELSISMIIIGFLMVGAITLYKIYDEKRRFEITELRITDVEQAINDFVATNGRLPCAAPRGVERTSSQYGREDNCQGGASGTVSTNGKNGTKVRVGMLPARTLGISDFYMEDAYDHAFLYAVTEDLTLAANYKHDGGGIDVLDAAGVSRLKDSGYAQYVLISPGTTDYGAYSNMGQQIISCDTKRLEGENCDDDGVFVDTDLAQGTEAGFFDDRALYKYRLPVTLEQEAPPSCTQQDSVFIAGNTCPEGWERDPVVNQLVADNKVQPLYLGQGPSRKNYFEYNQNDATRMNVDDDKLTFNQIVYYNEYPDGSGYFFSNTAMPTTVDTGYPRQIEIQNMSGINKTVYCKKKADNKMKKKCFSESIPVSGVPNSQSTGLGLNLGNDGDLGGVCPDGYVALNLLGEGTMYQGAPMTIECVR